jgi:hypothetical protein
MLKGVQTHFRHVCSVKSAETHFVCVRELHVRKQEEEEEKERE